MHFAKRRFERLIVKIGLWVVFAALVVLGVFLMGATWEVWQKEREARRERDAALELRNELLERKARLEHSLGALETERGLEAEIRKRFMVAKDGEEIIMLVDAKDTAVDTGTNQDEAKGWWQTLQAWFGF